MISLGFNTAVGQRVSSRDGKNKCRASRTIWSRRNHNKKFKELTAIKMRIAVDRKRRIGNLVVVIAILCKLLVMV